MYCAGFEPRELYVGMFSERERGLGEAGPEDRPKRRIGDYYDNIVTASSNNQQSHGSPPPRESVARVVFHICCDILRLL